MIERLLSLFRDEQKRPEPHHINLACAALLAEVMRADHSIDAEEEQALTLVLKNLFNLSSSECSELLQDALQRVEISSDLFQFTAVINQQLDAAAKFRLMTGLWQVAYSSNGLDKYEEHIIRRIAELLYVPHSEFIRAKLEARDSQ
ncbi:tellurite resistance TerB family protein [Thalassolituus alkanivorans]|uniref:tellurite resistance TerB family protein n=1 Tax=Thalassolituus alkanivorans TaxID=2881055 RepID=UPI001E62FA02|nr:TerB family tellurite resistance protein [Thalassolituus alkanivorans]MCB2387881.1 TerB family tellurite resistance protein [Thalassolituus alkanivorans]MCB2422407.1 TerB family tellurite resistance protein [Thalassolituus alkanivorans]